MQCEACGSSSRTIETYGAAYRQREMRAGRCDPGALCLGCAELWTRMLRLEGSPQQTPKRYMPRVYESEFPVIPPSLNSILGSSQESPLRRASRDARAAAKARTTLKALLMSPVKH